MIFRGMIKKLGLFVLILLILLVIAGFFLYQTLLKSDTVKAQLNVESGEVRVDGKIVDGNVRLKEGSIIETLEKGLATVILYESILVSLSENSRVKIDELILEHPKVTQEKGKTWNKFTKLFGSEDYSIKTGNAVASVRGTAFLITENKLVSGEGEVDYERDGKSFVVAENKAVEKRDGEILERDATREELREIRQYNERTIKMLKILRELEIKKKGFLLEQIKKRFSITDEQIQEAFLEADEGSVDIDKVISEYKDKIPVKMDLQSVDKIIGITKEIQELNKELDEINS